MRFLTLAVICALGCGLGCSTTSSKPEFMLAEGALGPYSDLVRVGDLVFVSGKIGSVRDASFAEEVESAIDRVEEALARVGLNLTHAVAATVFLTDIDNYAAVNEVYARRFSSPYPARACVAVKALPAGARVEIQVTAAGR